MNEQTEFNKLLKIIEATPLFELDTEYLDNRLLKGKFDVMKLLGTRNYKGLTKAQGNISYLKGLKSFLQNLKGFCNCCSYADDDRIKIELNGFLFKLIKAIDDLIVYWIDEQEAISERIEKDKNNSFEAEILNEGC